MVFTGGALTDWQSASLNFFALQPMKMMDAEKEKAEFFLFCFVPVACLMTRQIITNVLTNDGKY